MTSSDKGALQSGEVRHGSSHNIGDAIDAACHSECEAAITAARHEDKKCAEAALAPGPSSLIMPKHRVHEMVLLKTIAETLNQSHELSSMLHSVLEKLLELTGLTTGWIFLSERYMDFCCVAEQNLPPALTGNNGKRMNLGSCWCLDRYWDGRLVNAINILNCKRLEDAVTFRWGDTQGITHHATVPLRTGKELVGLLNVAAPGKVHFTDEELALLQSVAFQMGSAIERIYLYAAEQRRAEMFARLDEFSRALTGRTGGCSDLVPVAKAALHLIGEHFHWPIAALYEQTDNKLSLRSAQIADDSFDLPERMTIDDAAWIGEAITTRRLRSASAEEAALLFNAGSREGRRRSASKIANAVAVPLPFGDTGYSVLVIGSTKRDELNVEDRPILEALAEHIAGALESTLLADHRKELTRIEERNRLARDLHDSVSQLLFSLSMTSRGVESLLTGPAPDTEAALEAVRDLQSLSQSALKEMRSLILQLRPAELQAGLVTALREYGERLGLQIATRVDGVRGLPRPLEDALWRIGQEALNNVSKHAGTSSAEIMLTITSLEVTLRIADKGQGLPDSSSKLHNPTTSIGLSTMRERAEALGGTVSIIRRRSGGTAVEAIIPMRAVNQVDGNEGNER
ncbi:histidine kinase [Paenibacillus sp. CCS19]|uniref:GAF domain-containing sensor histidine kinase n=1 Tax=Paenibacillus sp. CCS19 TaxID=3158387 RepID=UPI00256D07CE|nr:GAF domain-containing sensor histidine kinase [Paenibacillus cellulosilyticus]GMK40060.1 histidine kinase [Paenibacillus cellulosilyticus]